MTKHFGLLFSLTGCPDTTIYDTSFCTITRNNNNQKNKNKFKGEFVSLSSPG